MDGLRQYIVSVMSAALLGGILTGLMHRGLPGELMKLVCAVMLTVVLIRPLADERMLHRQSFSADFTGEARSAAAAGERSAADSLHAIIKQQTQAYIQNKAGELGLSLAVEVTLSPDTPPVPAQVRISGKAAPLAKQRLTEAVTEELGITKENLIWTG